MTLRSMDRLVDRVYHCLLEDKDDEAYSLLLGSSHEVAMLLVARVLPRLSRIDTINFIELLEQRAKAV